MGWKNGAGGRQVEDQIMFGFITRQASSVGAQPRQQVPADTFREPSRSSGGARRAVGVALMAIGQRVAGEMPAPPVVRAESDCG
ncbi:MAG: hypothetical protein ACXWL8_05970 [Candidatus Limnocylindria bacterium]